MNKKDEKETTPIDSAWGGSRPSTKWIKKWGYGPVAYLLDFLDPLLKQDFLLESRKIWQDVKKINPDDNDDY